MINLVSKSKWPRRTALYGVVFSLLLSVYLFSQTGSYFVFPLRKEANSVPGFAYDDREQGGNSTSKIAGSQKVMNVRFQLGSKYTYPYAGVSFPLLLSSEYKLISFNSLRVSLKVWKKSKILVIFSQHRKQSSLRPDIIQHCEYLLSCSPEETEYTIPFSSFQVPPWWIKLKQKAEPVLTDWSEINTLSFQNDPSLPNGSGQTISIQIIQFTKLYKWPLYSMGIFFVMFVLLEYALQKQDKRIDIRYVPVSDKHLESAEPWDILANYLAQHYREDISLESVFKEVGIAKHRISSLIRENTSLNFRQYINKIRIREAERLFNITTLSVTEIGYEVGYTSATQFNRVFREIKGVAPSEYKKEISR